MWKSTLIYISVLLSCCQTDYKPSGQKDNSDLQNNNEDTLVVKKNAAVIFYPDSSSIEHLRKTSTEDEFYTAADDNMYYIYQARTFLEKKDIQLIETDNSILKFINSEGEAFMIYPQKSEMMWGIILFKVSGKPTIISTIDVPTEYENYFDPEKKHSR